MYSEARPRCSLIIRCFNEEQHIGRLLSGLMQQTVRDVEIILVDSGSTDATLSIASRYPVTIVSIRPEDFSFGRALNVGCQAAHGEFLVLASAHVYPVYHDWLEHLLAPFTDPRVALVYGKQRGNEMTKFSEYLLLKKWFPDSSRLQLDNAFCNNANAAVRRELWEELPYDETLTGLEDLDWARRAIARGYRIAYAAEAEIIHAHDESPRHLFNRYRREAIAIKRIFPEERFSFWDFLKLFSTNVVSDCYHAHHEHILRREFRGIVTFRLMQFWGTYRGFTQRGVSSQLKQTFYYPNELTRMPTNESARQCAAIDYSSRQSEMNVEQVAANSSEISDISLIEAGHDGHGT